MRNAWKFTGIILLAVAAIMGVIIIVDAHPAQAQRQSSYAIYLSPGPRPDVSWGGYHVTITGFSQNHAPGKSQKREAAKAWKKVHGSGTYSFAHKQRGKDYWAHDLGGDYGYGVCFKSKELDRLTFELNKANFDNQKQLDNVNNGKSCRWHVSLYANTPEEAYHKFEKYLKPTLWSLYEVKYPGSEWTAI